MEVTQCSLKFAPAFNKGALSPLIDWILGQALQDYSGVQVGANIHASDLPYAEDIVIFSSSYREIQGLLETVSRHVTAVGMRIHASKTKAS